MYPNAGFAIVRGHEGAQPHPMIFSEPPSHTHTHTHTLSKPMPPMGHPPHKNEAPQLKHTPPLKSEAPTLEMIP